MGRGSGLQVSTRRRHVIGALLLASLVVVLGVTLRIDRTGDDDTINLVWNLFLAWIPFVLALVVYDRARRDAAVAPTVAAALLWLLFLPNAPYIVTDYIWLDDWRGVGVPLWYDATLYVLAAAAGGILGFVSLFLVHRVAARAAGEVFGWAVAVPALLLSGIGVYLGRVLRWNSWDVFTRPEHLLRNVLDGLLDLLAYPRAFTITVATAAALVAGYVVFYGVFRGRLERAVDR